MAWHLSTLMAQCSQDGPILPATLFLAGLFGGIMHCAAMCGPFVLGQVADGLARVPAARLCEASRLRSGLLLPYHCGRLVTYSVLGGLAGGLAGTLPAGPVPGLLLLGGAGLFLGMAVCRLAPRFATWRFSPHAAPRGLVKLLGLATGGLDRSKANAGLLLGLVLGLLPCGMLYAALTVAAGTGSAMGGALAMAAFGLGTVPSLVVVGVAGHAAARHWRRSSVAIAPAVLLVNAMLLAIMAWRALASA